MLISRKYRCACCNLLGTSTPHALLHFLNSYWNLSVQNFAKTARTNFVKTAVSTLEMWKEHLTKKLETAKPKPVFSIVAADGKALYPNLYRDTVTKALECALEKQSDYSAEARKIIVELNKSCLNNVVTQYWDQLYIQKSGIITGDNNSVALANITVHYILQPIADVLNEAELFVALSMT